MVDALLSSTPLQFEESRRRNAQGVYAAEPSRATTTRVRAMRALVTAWEKDVDGWALAAKLVGRSVPARR